MEENNTKSSRSNGLVIALIIVVLAIAALATIGFLSLKPEPDTVQGQADATEIRVSGKLPGRVVALYVKEGDMVHKGDTLVHIHSSVMDAKLDQARAMENAAAATNRKVDAGARSQIIASAYDLYRQATAAREIAQKTAQRMENLYAKGVVSAQKRDEAKAAFDASVAGEHAAKSQWELAKSGAQSEDKDAARAMVNVAKGGVAEADALLEDSYLLAPCDGIVAVIYPHESELVMTGAPIMSIRQDNTFAIFNVRENLLKDLPLGAKIKVGIPALDKEATFTVFFVKSMGSYANWQATKATGSYDARTFEIKARPDQHIDGFIPGMSVIYLGPAKR